MTEIPPNSDKNTSLAVFLASVCPGLPTLDDNIHFSLRDSLTEGQLNSIDNFNWPLRGSNISSSVKASLDPTYLHVARPPFQQDSSRNIESTTYVPLPLHYTSMFSKIMQRGDHKQDGGKHIGASVNPLQHDPYRLVYLNPGCLSSLMPIHNSERTSNKPAQEFRNPFNKMTSSINRLLRKGGSETSQATYWQSIIMDKDYDDHNGPSSKTGHHKGTRVSTVVSTLIDFDRKHYFSQLESVDTSKLLVSANINVVNVFALSENGAYLGTSDQQSTTPIFPQAPAPVSASTQSSNSNSGSVHSSITSYKKVIERPMLRMQLNSNLLITAMATIPSEMLIILGLNTGDILIINLASLTYRLFDNLGNHAPMSGFSDKSSMNAITSLCVACHPSHHVLIFAGCATGEVVIIDPILGPSVSKGSYTKDIVGSDQFVTLFKKFDLSGWAKSEPSMVGDTSPGYLIGHFKISHKPITSIATTIPHECSGTYTNQPMVMAFASEDGLVRFMDLTATYGRKYGNADDALTPSILTDVVSNYFQDGIRDIDFSADNKFFAVCGKGDLVEIFRMSYYNVNALLQQEGDSSTVRGGRSRSGTVNSSNSSNIHSSVSFLGYGSLAASFALTTTETLELHFAPALKDIAIVSRLKAHSNTVQRVMFVDKHQYASSQGIPGTGNYGLITCGSDGKFNLWDFNSKALPRVKKSHFNTNARRLSKSPSTVRLSAIGSRGNTSQSLTASRSHKTSWSLTNLEEFQLGTSFSKLGINSLLGTTNQVITPPDNSEERLRVVFSLYRSLYEIRLRKHYAKQKRERQKKYPCVIHGIVNDKDLPSIQVPLLTMDLSPLFKNGHVAGFQCCSTDFWLYGKSGDIFRYSLGS